MLAIAVLASFGAGVAVAAEPAYDVVVYGGTSAGVAAAVQVARMGKSAVLIEPGRHLGGLTSGGLGATDIGNKQAIGGIAREFYARVRKHYAKPEAWTHESLDQYRKRSGFHIDDQTMWGFEPHVAEAIFEAMIREAHVPVVRGERLDLARGVEKSGARIVAIRMESGRRFAARMFIDATYEGDLMAKAGVSYTIGRESNAQYGETLNGSQVARSVHHQFVKALDPYLRPGDPASGLLPGIEPGPPGEDGQGDHRVQAYCFRICTTDVAANRRPWPKPEGYDPRRYEILLRNFEAGDHRVPWAPVPMPNRKTDTNNNFAVSTDNIGMNYDYPDGDYAARERIVREHETYQKGLCWTLANSPRVPANVRREFQRLALAKDEFTDNGNWPHQLYVREARRMVSDYVMTEGNCTGRRVAEDSAGLGAYGMDSHNIRRYVDSLGHVRNEGDVQVGGFSPYPVSYRSIVPKASQCTNLLVPVCLSASHIAYGSIRMEPVFMILGQSAATAAVQTIDAGTTVQGVDYTRLRARLVRDGQVLVWTGPKHSPAVSIDPCALPGIVVDDPLAQATGQWTSSAAIGPFIGHGYLHDGDEGKGAKSITFEARLPADGRYEVRLAYSPGPNRAAEVPVRIEHADCAARVTINQRKKPPIAPAFVSLGVFRFTAARPARVTISNQDTRGHVIADAVQFMSAAR
jgi:hypothetical protein